MKRTIAGFGLFALAGMLSGCGESSYNTATPSAELARQSAGEMVKVTGLQKARGSSKSIAQSAAGQMSNGFGKR